MITRRIDLLQIGQRVDLEGDIIADPDYAVSGNPQASEHPEFQFEFETVVAITHESFDCMRIDFESGFACGFPPDYEIEVDGEQRLADIKESPSC